ncbi:MAG: DUF1801 domain-containing protein [Chloroflexota bacterium]
MSETKFGTFEELVAMTPEELKPIIIKLRELVLAVDPNSTEVIRLGDRAATFGVGPKKMSEGYVYVMPHKKWINLGFYKGALLPDPASLMEGTGKKLRHIKMRALDEISNPAIRTLVEQAYKERKKALGK